MEHQNFPVKLFAGLAISAAVLISACHNNDTVGLEDRDTASISASDTINTFHVDSSGRPSGINDTGSIKLDSGMKAPEITDTAAIRDNKMQKKDSTKNKMPVSH